MLKKIPKIIKRHIAENSKKYLMLFAFYFAGAAAGAFCVNGLNSTQKNELLDYFNGFIELFNNHGTDTGQLFKSSLLSNYMFVLLIILCAVSIIGFFLIYIIIAVKGFISGFSSGIIIGVAGMKGMLFVAVGLLPKEIIVVPCIIGIGVSCINYSLSLLKHKSVAGHFSKHIKSALVLMLITVLIYGAILFAGVIVETYVIPVLIRMIIPIFN